MLVINAVQAVNINKNGKTATKIIDKISFSGQFEISEKNDYLCLKYKDSELSITDPGKPMLPVFKKTYTFSRNVKLNSISCDIGIIQEKSISGKIIPVPEIIPQTYTETEEYKLEYIENNEVYENADFYPDTWYDYSIRCGLDKNEMAVKTAKENLRLNRIAPQKFSVKVGNLVAGIQEKYDLVVANILTQVIYHLLEDVEKILNEKAIFICSGILEENENLVLGRMKTIGFEILDLCTKDQWVAIAGRYMP